MTAGTKSEPAISEFRQRLIDIVESGTFRYSILGIIFLNAMTLGLATSTTVMDAAGPALKFFDDVVLIIFIIELAIKFMAYHWRFFLNGWNIFDLIVVSFSLLPQTGELSVLRALRIVRVMRVMSVVPQMRQVIQALIDALPGMASVIALLLIVFYIFAVMATRLFGHDFDVWFGDVGRSLYSLFQIMTLESWSMGIVRPVMEVYPMAWLLFVPFIIMTAFAVLNLFIGLLVNTMQNAVEVEREDDMEKLRDLIREENRAVADQVAKLQSSIDDLEKKVSEGGSG